MLRFWILGERGVGGSKLVLGFLERRFFSFGKDDLFKNLSVILNSCLMVEELVGKLFTLVSGSFFLLRAGRFFSKDSRCLLCL